MQETALGWEHIRASHRQSAQKLVNGLQMPTFCVGISSTSTTVNFGSFFASYMNCVVTTVEQMSMLVKATLGQEDLQASSFEFKSRQKLLSILGVSLFFIHFCTTACCLLQLFPCCLLLLLSGFKFLFVCL